MADYFQLSKVIKSFERSVMDALKHGRKSDRVCHCDDIAQIRSEIFVILRRQILKINSLLQVLIEEENHFALTTFSKDPCLL